MKRVMIVGQPGSGKSTLAQAIGRITGLTVVHIDKIHWRSGWIERSPNEKSRLCREVEMQERWIFEGGHSATWDTRIARADLLIWLDRSIGLRIWRVLRRTSTELGHTREDLPQGRPEQLGLLPGFLRFIWTTRHTSWAHTAELAAAAPPSCGVIHLRTNREVGDFLSNLECSPASRFETGSAS